MSHTDIKTNTLIEHLPVKLRPYALLMRLDRPAGTWLLLLPALWAIALAAGGVRHFTPQILAIAGLFAVGAVVMRGAGCIVNDLWDVRFDREVERTRSRPLASGAANRAGALFLLAGLLAIGLAILSRLSLVAILLGVLSLPLIAVYPLMKRWTYWPQAFLGLTFNFGALMGWAAVTEVLALPALLLYAAGFFWTLGYDTVYAHQDKEDDALVGVRSTALLLGASSRRWVGGFYAAALVLLAAAGMTAGAGPAYYAALALAGWQAADNVRGWNIDDPADSLKRFRAARDFGLIVLAACLVSGLV